jgi:hypothetical protein
MFAPYTIWTTYINALERTTYINALVFESVYKTKIRLTSLSEINKLNSFVIVIYKIEARRTVLVI